MADIVEMPKEARDLYNDVVQVMMGKDINLVVWVIGLLLQKLKEVVPPDVHTQARENIMRIELGSLWQVGHGGKPS